MTFEVFNIFFFDLDDGDNDVGEGNDVLMLLALLASLVCCWAEGPIEVVTVFAEFLLVFAAAIAMGFSACFSCCSDDDTLWSAIVWNEKRE